MVTYDFAVAWVHHLNWNKRNPFKSDDVYSENYYYFVVDYSNYYCFDHHHHDSQHRLDLAADCRYQSVCPDCQSNLHHCHQNRLYSDQNFRMDPVICSTVLYLCSQTCGAKMKHIWKTTKMWSSFINVLTIYKQNYFYFKLSKINLYINLYFEFNFFIVTWCNNVVLVVKPKKPLQGNKIFFWGNCWNKLEYFKNK